LYQVAQSGPSVSTSVTDAADVSADNSVATAQDAQLNAVQALLNNMDIPAPRAETLIHGTFPASEALISDTSHISESASFLKVSETAPWIPDLTCHTSFVTPRTDAVPPVLLRMVPISDAAPYIRLSLTLCLALLSNCPDTSARTITRPPLTGTTTPVLDAQPHSQGEILQIQHLYQVAQSGPSVSTPGSGSAVAVYPIPERLMNTLPAALSPTLYLEILDPATQFYPRLHQICATSRARYRPSCATSSRLHPLTHPTARAAINPTAHWHKHDELYGSGTLDFNSISVISRFRLIFPIKDSRWSIIRVLNPDVYIHNIWTSKTTNTWTFNR
jgi:hypothetical protein